MREKSVECGYGPTVEIARDLSLFALVKCEIVNSILMEKIFLSNAHYEWEYGLVNVPD